MKQKKAVLLLISLKQIRMQKNGSKSGSSGIPVGEKCHFGQ